MANRGSTRIFEVGFFVRNLYDGKALDDEEPTFDRTKVVASDAKQAVALVETMTLSEKTAYDDDDTKKTVVVTHDSFDPVQVELLAEA
jgi:predicted NAD/FAD-binding protein